MVVINNCIVNAPINKPSIEETTTIILSFLSISNVETIIGITLRVQININIYMIISINIFFISPYNIY